ncbi:MAG: hypothetical protein JSR80_00375, partial [Verrucomicrobia bacterium]|nr:hypothetical protein [Verrucomicrobiota bacterium]
MFLILKRYRYRYLLALCSVIAANILLVTNPLIFRHALAQKLEGSFFDSIWSWGALLLFVATLGALFRYWMRLLFIAISREAERDLRERLFLRIQAQAQPFYDRYSIGDLMSRFTNDVAVYREVLGPGIMYPTFFITLVIPVLIALFSISARLALIALLPIVILPPLMLLARALVFRTSVEVQTALGGMSTLAQESLSGIRLIKAYGREGTFSLRFRELCVSFFRLSIRLVAITGLFFPFLSVIGRLVTVVLIVAAAFFSGLTSAD